MTTSTTPLIPEVVRLLREERDKVYARISEARRTLPLDGTPSAFLIAQATLTMLHDDYRALQRAALYLEQEGGR